MPLTFELEQIEVPHNFYTWNSAQPTRTKRPLEQAHELISAAVVRKRLCDCASQFWSQ